MAIERLAAIRTDAGVKFLCPDCKVQATQAHGAQNKDELAYLIICSKCGNILGQWTTAEQRDAELKSLAEKAKEA